jgi:hypothetical protein
VIYIEFPSCGIQDSCADACGLDDETVRQVKSVADFCEGKPEISGLSTNAVMPLIRIQDEEVRDKAISSVSNALKSGKHPITGKFLVGGSTYAATRVS